MADKSSFVWPMVEFAGVRHAQALMVDLPKHITEISGTLSLVPLAFRTTRHMSSALYAVDFGSRVVPYRTASTLGSGAYSVVYRLEAVSGDEPPLALKAYNRLDTDTGGDYIAIEQQLSVLGLAPPMVPAIPVSSTTIHHNDLVMSLASHTLRSVVSNAPAQPPFVTLSVMHALHSMQTHLIDKGVIHTDASVNNVLCVPQGGGRMSLVLADYGGAHRIGSDIMGCCTFGLPEFGYRPFAHIRTREQALKAAKYLAAAVAAAVHMRKRKGPLYEALTHRGSRRVVEEERADKHRELRDQLAKDDLTIVARWLDPDPDLR